MDVGHLFLAIGIVVAFPAGCWFTERYPTEPTDPDAPGLADVATRVVTYQGGWLPRRRAADARLQSAVRGPTPTGLPRRKAPRLRETARKRAEQ